MHPTNGWHSHKIGGSAYSRQNFFGVELSALGVDLGGFMYQMFQVLKNMETGCKEGEWSPCRDRQVG